jgi:MSHA pilin protein MshD
MINVFEIIAARHRIRCGNGFCDDARNGRADWPVGAPAFAAPRFCSHAGWRAQRGVSLPELIVFIVVVTIAVTGVLLTLNTVSESSADPLMQKQSHYLALSLLREIEFQHQLTNGAASPCVDQAGNVISKAGLDRTTYCSVADYAGLTMNGITNASGAAVPGLENYRLTVAVTGGPVLAGSGLAVATTQITVTVTDPEGKITRMSGYKSGWEAFGQ